MGGFFVALVIVCAGCYGINASTAQPSVREIPTGDDLNAIIDGSFDNLDNDNDGVIKRTEFNQSVADVDVNNNGCVTLEEYKSFSAGGPEIATLIYQYFDTINSNCLTVDDVASTFDDMEPDNDETVTKAEFRQYYINLLGVLFAS